MQLLKKQFISNPAATIAISAALALTFLSALSLYLNISNLRQENINLATAQAKANWNKDRAFRLWATRHGGVYVKPDQRTLPNPFLTHIKNRDVMTSSGDKLTLMNPAYMMRQMTEEFDELYGIKGRITGKMLLNTVNKPDEWEYQALTLFEQGVPEVIEETNIDDKPYLRYMKPMFMEQGCVRCHGHLGFKKGDLRGGVSISIPLAPYFAEAAKMNNVLITTHGIVWLLGLIFIMVFFLIVSEKSAENKALLKRMEYNAKRLQNSLNAAHAGTINYDLCNDEIHWDDTSYGIFDLSPKIQGLSYSQWHNLIHPDDADQFDQKIQEIILSQRQRLQLEFRTIIAADEVRWVKLWCNVFRDEQGKAHSIDGIMLDISQEKLNEQILQEKESAERFAQKQSTFLTNMSHEFRTPLHGILSFSKIGSNRIKQDDVQPDKFLDFFNSINISATRLLNLLNDLLDLAKLEAEQMEILLAPNDLFKTTQEVVKEQQFLLAEKNIVLQLPQPNCNTSLPFDKLRITQVLSNLLSNAIKFTAPQGEIKISFEHSELLQKDSSVPALCFSIIDNGRGIPKSELETVFDKFIQSSRNDPGTSGTGLGLAICREIVDAHQGKIWASQSKQGGASIHFLLPYLKDQ